MSIHLNIFVRGLLPCPNAFSEISNKCENYVEEKKYSLISKEEVERGKEQVYSMSVIILDDEDMEALQNGEMIHLQVNGEQTVGLATEKWAVEYPDCEEEENESKN